MKYFRKIREYYYLLIKGRESPERIAKGFAIGVFIAFSPFLGFHTGLCVVLSLLLNGSKTASILSSLVICNPLTIPVIFFSEYEIGKTLMKFLKLEAGVIHLSDFNHLTLKSIVEFGKTIALPIFIGSIVVGVVFSIIAYFISKRYFQKIFNEI